MSDAPKRIWAEPDGDTIIIHNGASNLEALIATGYLTKYIRADLAAPARVKPLVWHTMRDGSGHVWPEKWCADCPVFEKRFFAESTEHRAKVEAKRNARILAALEPAPDLAELVEALRTYRNVTPGAMVALMTLGRDGLLLADNLHKADDAARAALAKIKEQTK